MKRIFKIIAVSLALVNLNNCARDLSSSTYTEDNTISMTFEGKVIAVRSIKVKSSDKLSDNQAGIVGGALAGGAVGSTNHGSNRGGTMLGGALVGAVAGSVIEGALGSANGTEYIVKVDNSKIDKDAYYGSASMRDIMNSIRNTGLVTIIQGKENPLHEGQPVYVIISPKRSRVIAR